MPWCDDCSRFWTPTSMEEGGKCPTCGRVIVEPKERTKAPWHFLLLLVALVVYLSWRAWQGIVWVAHHT